MSTLALFNCRAVWRAGRSWRRRVGSWRSGVAGDCIIGETGNVEVDDPGGPDAVFTLPEPEDEDWDWVPREAAGLSTWADSESKRKETIKRHTFFHTLKNWVKSLFLISIAYDTWNIKNSYYSYQQWSSVKTNSALAWWIWSRPLWSSASKFATLTKRNFNVLLLARAR